jgi:hypothetical protein
MRPRALQSLAVAAAIALLGGAAVAQAPPHPGRKPDVKKDLFAVISLEGYPCGEVLRAERLGENDYLATCESGDRYRVYVGKNDRVVVERR